MSTVRDCSLQVLESPLALLFFSLVALLLACLLVVAGDLQVFVSQLVVLERFWVMQARFTCLAGGATGFQLGKTFGVWFLVKHHIFHLSWGVFFYLNLSQ